MVSARASKARPTARAPRDATRRAVASRIVVEGEAGQVELDLAESPLCWLATRKGRDGRALISPAQLLAGERLRLDFTRAGLTPRVTTNWSPGGRGTGGPDTFSDAVLAAKRRVQAALAAVGPELSGALLDVCCFLKGLEQIEQERGWPARAGKVVLGLGLDRLAAHYGLSATARGQARGPTRAWRAEAGE